MYERLNYEDGDQIFRAIDDNDIPLVFDGVQNYIDKVLCKKEEISKRKRAFLDAKIEGNNIEETDEINSPDDDRLERKPKGSSKDGSQNIIDISIPDEEGLFLLHQ